MFEATKATVNGVKNNNSSKNKTPFMLISVAEANCENKHSVSFIQNNLTHKFARRCTQAKRSVEEFLSSGNVVICISMVAIKYGYFSAYCVDLKKDKESYIKNI